MTNDIIFLICLSVLIAILLVGILCNAIHKRNVRIVKSNSELYKQLIALNEKFSFYTQIQELYSFHEICNSKRKFDNVNFENFAILRIEENLDIIKVQIELTEENIKLYREYCNFYDQLKSTTEKETVKKIKPRISYGTFIRLEKKLFIKDKCHPITKFTLYYSASYTSPQGRNHYRDYEHYSYEQVKRFYILTCEVIERRKTAAYQRSKMTDSIRYDVLKRDNHRCKICGLTANDGVKLHVDHIKPVSKGGKTEMSNLQTLCERCNQGKSNKI